MESSPRLTVPSIAINAPETVLKSGKTGYYSSRNFRRLGDVATSRTMHLNLGKWGNIQYKYDYPKQWSSSFILVRLKSSGRPSIKVRIIKGTRRHKYGQRRIDLWKLRQTSSLRKLRNALRALQKKPQIVFAVRRSDTKKQRERTLRGKSCGNKLCSVRTKNNEKWRRQSFGIRVWKATNYLPLLWTEATQRKNVRAPGILRIQNGILPQV